MVWVARYLGAKSYGTYLYAVGLAEIVMLFWSQGLKEVIVHEISEQGLEKREVSVASFQLILLGNIVLYGILAGILYFFIDDRILKTLSFLCGLGIIFRSFEGFELWFHAAHKIKITVRVQFIVQIIYVGGITLLMLKKASLLWFGIAYAGQLIFVGIGFAIVYAIENGRFTLFGNFRRIQLRLFNSGKYMLLAKLTFIGSFILDRFIIEYLMNMEAVAFYTMAIKMTTIWTFVGSSISLSFLPLLSDVSNTKQFHSITKEMFKWLIISSLVLVIPFFILSDQIILFVLGTGYSSSTKVFEIVIWTLPFLLLNEGFKSYLVVIGKTKYYAYATTLMIIFLFIGNMILTPLYGIKGAAYVFLMAWFFGGLLIYMGFKDLRKLFFSLSEVDK